MRKGPVLPALFFALPVADVLPFRPVVLPAQSLGKRCRPVVLPTCCAAGQLPAGCPTLPARHSGSVAGPVVLPVKIGPTLPAGCRRAARGAAGPVTREALPARGAARSRSVAGPYCRRNPCNPTFSILSSGIPRLLRLPIFDSGRKKCNVNYRETYTSSKRSNRELAP